MSLYALIYLHFRWLHCELWLFRAWKYLNLPPDPKGCYEGSDAMLMFFPSLIQRSLAEEQTCPNGFVGPDSIWVHQQTWWNWSECGRWKAHVSRPRRSCSCRRLPSAQSNHMQQQVQESWDQHGHSVFLSSHDLGKVAVRPWFRSGWKEGSGFRRHPLVHRWRASQHDCNGGRCQS